MVNASQQAIDWFQDQCREIAVLQARRKWYTMKRAQYVLMGMEMMLRAMGYDIADLRRAAFADYDWYQKMDDKEIIRSWRKMMFTKIN